MTLSGAGQAWTDPVAGLDRLLANKRCWAAAVIAVLALQSVLIWTHRHWLDEWQALQIAAATRGDTALLFANLRYEGHPPLWYVYLWAVGALVPFAWVLKAAVWPLAMAAQAMLLLRAPFTHGERLLIALGTALLFDFLTLSRSLALGVTLLLALAALWPQRRAPWAAIILLPMTDFLFGVLSLLAVIARWRCGLLWGQGTALWVASAAFAAWSVIPAPDMAPALAGSALWSLTRFAQNLGMMLVPLHSSGWALHWNSYSPLSWHVGLATLFLLFAYRLHRGRAAHAALFWSFVAIVGIFSVTVYPLAFRHAALIALLAILLAWHHVATGSQLWRGFRPWLLAGALCGGVTALHALRTPFDRATDVAAWIKRQGLAQENWAVFQDSRAQAVSALSGIHFERLDQGCRVTFIRWNQPRPLEEAAEIEARLRRFTAQHGRGYLLTELPLPRVSPTLLRPIATFPGGFNGQDYRLWEIVSAVPPKGTRSAYCAPEMARGNGRPMVNPAVGSGQSALPPIGR